MTVRSVETGFAGAVDVRRAVHLLSGYLCGTHSGARGGIGAVAAAAGHTVVRVQAAAPTIELSGARWSPSDGPAITLRARLCEALDRPEVVDLLVLGSQARGTATGCSDVDALLVLDERAADDARALARLRPHVLAAQRAVLAYQPLQHHGFLVVSERLLAKAATATGLPAETLVETRSLLGRPVRACLGALDRTHARVRLRELATAVCAKHSWPRHTWDVHVLVSQFALVPALYLQAEGEDVPKWRSFDEASERLGSALRGYAELEAAREVWPRRGRPLLAAASCLARNPWLAVAVWRRLPAPAPREVEKILGDETLRALQSTVREVTQRLE